MFGGSLSILCGRMPSILLGRYGRDGSIQNLSRQSTLESGTNGLRAAWNRSFRRQLQPHDEFEQLVLHKSQSGTTKEKRELKALVQDYRRLRARPGAEISQSLVWLQDFASPTPRPLEACKLIVLKRTTDANSRTKTFSRSRSCLTAGAHFQPASHSWPKH